MKPGYRTTEFWVSLLGMVLPAVLPGQVDAGTASAIAAGVAALYTVGRSLVKAFQK